MNRIQPNPTETRIQLWQHGSLWYKQNNSIWFNSFYIHSRKDKPFITIVTIVTYEHENELESNNSIRIDLIPFIYIQARIKYDLKKYQVIHLNHNYIHMNLQHTQYYLKKQIQITKRKQKLSLVFELSWVELNELSELRDEINQNQMTITNILYIHTIYNI